MCRMKYHIYARCKLHGDHTTGMKLARLASAAKKCVKYHDSHLWWSSNVSYIICMRDDARSPGPPDLSAATSCPHRPGCVHPRDSATRASVSADTLERPRRIGRPWHRRPASSSSSSSRVPLRTAAVRRPVHFVNGGRRGGEVARSSRCAQVETAARTEARSRICRYCYRCYRDGNCGNNCVLLTWGVRAKWFHYLDEWLKSVREINAGWKSWQTTPGKDYTSG